MNKPELSFAEIIETAKSAEVVSNHVEVLEHTSGSRLAVRSQGCFVTELTLTHPNYGAVDVLYSSPDLRVSKLTASHIMSPVGPSEGIGGQHGFARWAAYQGFPQNDSPDGEKREAFQAKRSDNGIGVSKLFTLDADSLVTETTLYNPDESLAQTSLGEHLYFTLENEIFDGLTVNGHNLDELLGAGSLETIKHGDPLFWKSFDGDATIHFPAGHDIEIHADVTNSSEGAALGMLVWHKTDSSSICFEPTLGLVDIGDNEALEIPARSEVTLTTSLKLV